ncbi:mycothiol transferase [Sinomonas halotolerans]|uniref:DinB family protein n=1 Tax=Sinomonas halotolerans TaxID=1644133 RepID=A0ABU9WYK4_9MICC
MQQEWAVRILEDGFERVREEVEHVLLGLTPAQLAHKPGPRANSVAWLVWHLTRIEDDHIASLAGVLAGAEPPAAGDHEVPPGQLWPEWTDRFGLPYPLGATGYGHRPEDVSAFHQPDPELLRGYHEAVHARVLRVIGGLGPEDWGRIVDRRWTPHVTAAVRLVSVLNDATQHVGQAAYVRGLILSA